MGQVLLMADAKSGKKKTLVTLDEDSYRVLRAAQAKDDISLSHRVRALLELWMSNETVRNQVDRRASQIADADKEERYQRRSA